METDAQIKFYQNKLSFEMDPSDLFDALTQKQNVIPIDARKPVGFEKERIPFALNIPHREMNLETTKLLDKDALYVIYCDGIGCNGSTRGALNMTKLGFKVKELMGGLEWWKFDGYATEGSSGQTNGSKIECAC